MDIKAYLPISNYLNATFNYSFPLFSQYFSNKQTYRANLNLAVSLFNNTTNYKNDDEGILFNSRFNSNIPVRIDTWDEEKKYMNAGISLWLRLRDMVNLSWQIIFLEILMSKITVKQ
ncbi:hypothetical protein QW060_26945 [Myroides ceti]|uniref:Outer membrane protein beta-barrel domain-containing protein n=1 Tax=Paenimyroides ceti TaxID=395087 RepID=A0ABT8D4U6_9FLAO|nr:hypothetical protein [Paenimyroides ceti]MDN3710455.1 hypothetical protein [Paenimyroides ceti]